ncbi:hypothetical protein IPL85_00745 [Candidatus Saccharibacteria bacterium]|nr:MAG: hypothetical protein IPL85_00745 [Candidatus Saccharibacteria bacterium]
MDEDQPATQPHLSPAEMAALEEERLRTADDSFVAGGQSQFSGGADVTSKSQTTFSAAKKVTLTPVNDLSGYSVAPSIPRATETTSSTPAQQPGIVATPAPTNLAPQASVVTPGVAPAVSDSLLATPQVSLMPPVSPEPNHAGQDLRQDEREMSTTGRVAARVSMLQVAAVVGMVLFGLTLYLVFSVSHQYMSGAFFRLAAPTLIQIIIYTSMFIYLFFTASVRGATTATLVLLALIGQGLLLSGLSFITGLGTLLTTGRAVVVLVIQLILFGVLFVAHNRLRDLER